ncbi:hypothetical protein HO133_009090 [Letharia lupina]|uniref:Uncharacterized protein n=1 Tax=Letharia lupina TaxID=560253 RepID=A0A8H6CN02_9LECA|nr:uncharacterized protein HO133_009090 [Letharia lupina]KAF6226224.1 hypothetical protein HO133_009090 [Letharia lupina]
MDPNGASAPSLISSLEAMIQASVTAVLDRRLGTGDTLDAQIQTTVSAALDKRLGPAVGSLGNRMTSLVEQRLGSAISTLNFRVNTSVTAALEQRLGPAGSALTAQITFTAAPLPVLPSVAPPKAQALGVVNGTKESNETCPAEEELGKAQPISNGASTEIEQPTPKQSQGNGGPPEKERPAQKLSSAQQLLDTGLTEKEQHAQRQNTAEPKGSKTTSPELGDELSLPTATSAESNESASASYPPFANGSSKSRAGPNAVLEAEPNAKTGEPSSSADKTPAKRKANQKDEANKADDTGEPESPSSEEESDHEQPKRKRAKVKLDPPGYTDGPSLKFRRVSPKLTACAKNRGYPRVIDLKGFTEASNKQNLTMADVVATVLFNYDPLSLYAFMDMDSHPTFHFLRKESDRKVRSLVIERRRESYGVVVKADRTKYRSDASRIWETKYEYIILSVGKWVASNYMQDPVISNSSKRTIEQWATEFGTGVFLGRLWVESPGAKIVSDRLELPSRGEGKT